MIFSSNKKDREFFLGTKTSIEDVTDQCGSLKPCIHGSDAHTEEKLFKPDQNRYCWIKADPTFEGLRQVIHEPDSRVKIQEKRPEEKKDYQVIDKIKFSCENFQKEEILFNQNLTVIIGGKSTGKSILLRSIAKAINSNEVEKRLKTINAQDYGNLKIESEISFQDGVKPISREDQVDQTKQATQNSRKIIYIPQSYLNKIVENKEKKDSFDEIIQSVLKQDETRKESFKKLESKNNEVRTFINADIDLFFNQFNNWKNACKEIVELGDKTAVQRQKEKYQQSLKNLEQSLMSDADIKEYNQLCNSYNQLLEKQKATKKDIENLKILQEQNCFDKNSNTLEILRFLDQDLKNKLTEDLEKIQQEAQEKWQLKITEKLRDLENFIKQSEPILNDLDLRLKNFEPSINNLNQVNELRKKIAIEEGLLNKIKQLNENETALRNTYRNTIEKIAKSSWQFYKNFNDYKDQILEKPIINSNLEFDLEIQPKNASFKKEFIEEIFNLKTLRSFEKVLLSNDSYTLKKNETDFIEEFQKIFKGIINDHITLKKNYSKEDAIRKLAQNWFIFKYKVTYENDELSSMYPGKRSLVLLKLLIELENSECPILLDQPEDDLDNRSIYNELVEFIKKKKCQRQIIIATHNPNLVVGADAECVIVADQIKEDKTSNFKFKYITGSLEDTQTNNNKNSNDEKTLENQGIKEHVCEILEGGKEAFAKREKKYAF